MLKTVTPKKSFFSKRIPTLIGLGILVVALIAGTVLFSSGTGVFAPRATPQTTPKKIRISNVTDTSFSISFLTDEATVGHIKYGTAAKDTKSQASDDRDQLSGTVDKYNLHHITVRGLDPATEYYYVLGTGSGEFDNEGQPFTIKTAQRAGVPSAAKTIYGSVVTAGGSPAEGTIVYVKTEGVGEMSSLVKSSGSWAIPLSNARLADGSTYAQITDENALTIFVQGTSANLSSQINTTVAAAQPVDNITLGEAVADTGKTQPNTRGTQPTPADTNSDASPANDQTGTQAAKLAMNPTTTAATQSANTLPAETNSATNSADSLNKLLADTNDATALPDSTASDSAITQEEATEIVDLATLDENPETPPTINTSQPKIVGKAAPNATISIEVHSDTAIDQYIVADANGNFELDISKLQEKLEPGEHTVTYSYEDPVTGKTVTKTETFYVADTAAAAGTADTSNQLAMANTNTDSEATAETNNSYPYSSSNPYPMESTQEAQPATREAKIATDTPMPVPGSVETTYALILGGLFFILAGVWSWWIANNLDEVVAES